MRRFLWATLLVVGTARADLPVSPLPAPPATPAPAATAPATATPDAPAKAAPPADAARLRETARAVLRDPEFRQRETSTVPVMRDWLRQLLRDWFKDKPRQAEKGPGLNLSVLAKAFQYLAVLALGLALAWLLWRGWQWLAPRAAPRPRPAGGHVLEARSLALPATPLPDGVATAAREAWTAGDATLALSLLYRGAVRELGQRHAIALPDSATEGECLRQARRSGAAVVAAGFAPIVQAWMALAYARRAPADFERLLALYREHFEPDPREAS